MPLPQPPANLPPAVAGFLGSLVNELEVQLAALRYVQRYTVAGLPSAVGETRVIRVVDEVGGDTLAFNVEGEWRRVQDRAVVT